MVYELYEAGVPAGGILDNSRFLKSASAVKNGKRQALTK
jgi:hypothetical protein